jgi:hypothetical protein
MNTEKKFKTKTGYCHILPDKIILTRDGVIGDLAKITSGNNIIRILLIYSGMSIYLIYTAYSSYQKNEYFSAFFFCIVALYLTTVIFKSVNNSVTPIIDRTKIKEVHFLKATVGITRARFEIMFEDENGKLKKRLILLPGSLSNGAIETTKALEIMKNEHLID